MKKILVSVAIAALALGAGAAQAATNLVSNGSFETGDFTAWTQFGDTSFTGVVGGCFDIGCPTDGAYEAAFGPVSGFGGITQTLTGGAGEYRVSFDLSDDSGYGFVADLGGTDFFTQGAVSSYGVTHFSFLVAAGADPTLTFSFYNPPAYYTLDNVVVTSGVPEPAGWALMICGMGVVGAGLRGRRKTAVVTA
jgi:hypothetical protein